ncbi:MAG TPA: ATP-binding protein [Parafilimonas sp.]|nr:ATP-binding protein [Parafilimonas sp.]
MRVLLSILALCYVVCVTAQNVETDSLKRSLSETSDDRKRVYVLEALSYAYLSSYPDTALEYALRGLRLAQDIKFLKGQATCVNAIGNVYFNVGDNAKALEMFLQYLKLKESLKDYNNISVAYYNIAGAYTEDKDYGHALFYIFKAKAEDEKLKDSPAILYDLYSLGSIYARMEQHDSALYYMNKCYALVQKLDDRNMIGAALNTLGEIYLGLNNLPQAIIYYRQSLPYAEEIKDYEVITANYYGLAKIYKQESMLDSSVYYARKAYALSMDGPFYKQALETSSFLSSLFKIKKIYDSAFHYQEMSITIKDSLFSQEKVQKVQNLKFEEQQRQQVIETERMKYRSTVKLSVVISIGVIFLVIALLLWRNNRQKQKANMLLAEQKSKVESTLEELKSAQARLIQSEKMASLGELTAGIAHEIQNPLNFVNNFSEINKELLEDLKAEITKGNMQEAAVIAVDVLANEEKINRHGRRAGAIVKSMLQHSGRNSGLKEPTDINALTDEYLRLSYHVLKTKDDMFQAAIKTDFDETLSANGMEGIVNVVPQDIGRVLLNIFNNAFYAVNEKKKTAGEKYQPVVSVTTKLSDLPVFQGDFGETDSNLPEDKAEVILKVSDNGTGIPKNVVDKIFQPFFTTKPTGKGTGLGLSLAYDIVKAHGGDLEVETTENEGTTFTIRLPLH